MKFSIRWVVIIGCIILVWSTYLILTPSVYFSTKKVMLRHTRDIMQNIADLTLQETQNFFSIARGSAHLTKKLISSKVVNTDNDSVEKLEQYFFDQLEIYPQFAGIYLALPNGNFYYVSRNDSHSPGGFRTKIIRHRSSGKDTRLTWRTKDMEIILTESDEKDTYDPRTRPWYKKASRENQIIWTDPYIFFTSQKPGITTAGPVYNSNGEIKGIVGVDIQLDVLSNFISRLRVGKTGIAFMMNSNRDVIAFPDPEQLKYENKDKPGHTRLPKIEELNNKICSMAYNAIDWNNIKKDTAGEPVFGTFKFENEKYFTMFTPVPESKVSWLIGLYLPEKDYFGEINANQKQNQLFSLILSIIATIAGLFMAGRITKPISELDKEAQNIKNNDYKSLPVIKSGFTEIQRTANTFHDMKKAVIDYKKELLEKEKIHRTITDTANDAIIMANRKGIISYWNMAAEKIFGYTKNETENKSVFDLIIQEKDIHLFSSTLKDFCDSGNMKFQKENTEIEIMHKSGKTIHVELSVARIKIEGIWYAIAIIRDITARKDAELEKMTILKQLQQSQKMESIGTLAGGIAHDFNNLLFPILGNSEILKYEMPQDDPLQENIQEIITATLRASDLAQQILTFSRPESSRIQSLELHPIINEVLKLIRSTIPASISINQDIEQDCGIIKADPTHIHQIIMNLSTNAYHAMENDSEGDLNVSLKRVCINRSDNISPDIEPGDYARLIIADTGIGMDENTVDKIFDPFFTTKEKGKGTGMGLSVVHGIVASLKGVMQVFSSPGKGTEFRIYLPLSSIPAENGKNILKNQVMTGTERILLVDDEEAIIKMEKPMIERLGYKVTAFTKSSEALDAFKKGPENFDIVVTDMAMPNMQGDILAGEMKKLRPEIPIILCTGFSNKISKEKAKDMGFKGFLLKPITLENLSSKIRQVLDGN